MNSFVMLEGPSCELRRLYEAISPRRGVIPVDANRRSGDAAEGELTRLVFEVGQVSGGTLSQQPSFHETLAVLDEIETVVRTDQVSATLCVLLSLSTQRTWSTSTYLDFDTLRELHCRRCELEVSASLVSD